MKSNYEINKDKILDDYYKCIGSFKNCKNLYKRKSNYTIKKNDSEEDKKIKKGMQEDLLSTLGKVGEKAFKYIIGLENLRISPNQDETSFESLWKKSSALKEFAKKHGIADTNASFITLLNYQDDNNQKAHNFDYWFSVMNLLMKKVTEKFKKFISYTIQTEVLIKYCEENDEFKYYGVYIDSDYEELSLPFRAAIFPNLIDLQYDNIPSLNEQEVSHMISLKRLIIKKNGDIFTRLRYASNNPKNDSFNIDEVFELISIIIRFIKMIHENNDNLDFDLNKSYAKEQSLKYKYYLNISEEEINNLFNLEILGTDLALTVFETNYSYKSIKKLLEIGVPKEDLRKVMREGLPARIVKQFFDRGIKDYRKMREMIDQYLDDEYPSDEYTYKKI